MLHVCSTLNKASCDYSDRRYRIIALLLALKSKIDIQFVADIATYNKCR